MDDRIRGVLGDLASRDCETGKECGKTTSYCLPCRARGLFVGPELFEMIVDGEIQHLTLRDAGVVFDSMYVKVEIGKTATKGLDTRAITKSDRLRIQDIADEVSASR